MVQGTQEPVSERTWGHCVNPAIGLVSAPHSGELLCPLFLPTRTSLVQTRVELSLCLILRTMSRKIGAMWFIRGNSAT